MVNSCPRVGREAAAAAEEGRSGDSEGGFGHAIVNPTLCFFAAHFRAYFCAAKLRRGLRL